jgi:hypothetical protein
MLEIIDLNRNEDLSASRMGEVVGGDDSLCGGKSVNDFYAAAEDMFRAMGCTDAANIMLCQAMDSGTRCYG